MQSDLDGWREVNRKLRRLWMAFHVARKGSRVEPSSLSWSNRPRGIIGLLSRFDVASMFIIYVETFRNKQGIMERTLCRDCRPQFSSVGNTINVWNMQNTSEWLVILTGKALVWSCSNINLPLSFPRTTRIKSKCQEECPSAPASDYRNFLLQVFESYQPARGREMLR